MRGLKSFSMISFSSYIYEKVIEWIRSKAGNEDKSTIIFHLGKTTILKCTWVHIKLLNVTPYIFGSHVKEKWQKISIMGFNLMLTLISRFAKTKAEHDNRHLYKHTSRLATTIESLPQHQTCVTSLRASALCQPKTQDPLLCTSQRPNSLRPII